MLVVSPMAWSPLEYLVIALSSQPEFPKAVPIDCDELVKVTEVPQALVPGSE